MMKISAAIIIYYCLLPISISYAQNKIPANNVISTDHLNEYLKENIKEEIAKEDKISEASLAKYFRQRFSERFFYDWHTFEDRFILYNQLYNNKSDHISNAEDHMQKFAASTQWLLPFNYLNGKEVNAYALRHLARQHKMVDIALLYFYNQKDPKYIQYFVDQMSSLNNALEQGKYEKIEDGNGIYEAFRSGYRVLNWLTIHNMFLGEKDYTDHDQLVTIATLLQHGENLYENNAKYQPGNHQTRGMSALAMLSILFRDFEGTDQWYARAMDRLEDHLTMEVNNDGFQFERSVHYHISDIENYFYVYQLAQISNIEVGNVWKEKLNSLFSTLVKISYPDKTAPVLQDDTDNPWAEYNDISGIMTMGYLLFKDPVFGYFAENRAEDKMYWFLPQKQLEQLVSIEKKKPEYGSLIFPETKYYIMREGWDENDQMMIISAGLDKEKPDHQHGDMLGIQAIANGKVILPNYQVRYSLPDYEFFKNSMVKNVALVDNELQGKEFTANFGGSGFGKFKKLPKPNTIIWQSNNDFDLFAGSHDGFENIGVEYSRQVIYVKNDFWVVKDNFQSDLPHVYKQIWQGHFTGEQKPNLLRANFTDASGCDIFQLRDVNEVYSSGKRGKEWTVVTKKDEKNFNFVTIVYPYKGYNNSIFEEEKSVVKGWKVNDLPFRAEGNTVRSLSKKQGSYIFGVERLLIEGVLIEFSVETDVFVQLNNKVISVHSIGSQQVLMNISGSISNRLNEKMIGATSIFMPGNILECEKE